jgi:hypothetical protein
MHQDNRVFLAVARFKKRRIAPHYKPLDVQTRLWNQIQLSVPDRGDGAMGTPAEYRKHARDCVELAERATAEHHRILLLRIADKWLLLASQAEREEKLLATENVKKAS